MISARKVGIIKVGRVPGDISGRGERGNKDHYRCDHCTEDFLHKLYTSLLKSIRRNTTASDSIIADSIIYINRYCV